MRRFPVDQPTSGTGVAVIGGGSTAFRKEKKNMMDLHFDKTAKGREEIATRRYQLAPRLRTLLVMIDGKQKAGELLKKVAAIGIDEQCVQELIDGGFITAPGLEAETSATPEAVVD